MKVLILFSLFAAFITGCQTVPYQGEARDVVKKPKREGTIAIPTKSRGEEQDRQKAEMKMQKNCNPLAYEVMEEKEVVVGQKTDSNTRQTERESSEFKVGSLFGVPVTSGEAGGQDTRQSAVTTNLKEWHIIYKCQARNSSASSKVR